jgi:6-phosphogluconolactonase (cycloisomerase 2 family)
MPLVFGRSIFGFAVADTGVTWTDPDLTNASYDSVSFSVTTQETVPAGIRFKNDGTKMYIIGSTSDNIHQYSLSTAWDVSTASYDSVSLSVATQELTSEALFFKSDGTSVYIVGRGSDSVFQYDLTTAWDISTGSYASKSMSVNSQEAAPRGLYFKDDGTKAYIVGTASDTVYQYALSTAWDISTGAFETGKSVSVSSQDTSPDGLYFNPDGDKMWISGDGNDTVFQYSLSTAWDVSTASYDSVSFSASTQDTSIADLTFKTDGSKMYLIGAANDTVYQYSTVVTWTNPNLATASYDSVSFSVGTQDGTPAAMFFKNDGTKVYMAGQGTDTLYEYSLSTAWDMSTASYNSVSLNITTNVANALGLYFRDDGLKMYLSSGNNNTIVEYNLSTAWDITTSSYNQNFSISGQDALAADLYFKDDGTKMYVIGYYGQDVNEYSLSTAWDISSASYNQNFSVATQETTPFALWFSPDGTRMYVAGNAGDDVNEYALSTGWDISTASYVQNFSVASQEITPRAIAFKSNGSKMYVIGTGNDTIYQYST